MPSFSSQFAEQQMPRYLIMIVLFLIGILNACFHLGMLTRTSQTVQIMVFLMMICSGAVRSFKLLMKRDGENAMKTVQKRSVRYFQVLLPVFMYILYIIYGRILLLTTNISS